MMFNIRQLALVTVTAALIIFYKFSSVPKYLFFDEAEFASLALSLQQQPYTVYSDLATGHSTLYFYILLASLKTFGIATFALRLPAAVFGLLSVVLFFIIMRIVFHSKKGIISYMPLITTFIFLSSRWFFNFARFSFEATFLMVLELTAMLFFFKYQKHQRLAFLIGTAVFAALSFYSYQPGRIFFLIPTLLLLAEKRVRQLLIYLVCVALLISPLGLHLISHPDTRVANQLFLRSTQLSTQEKIAYLLENGKKTTLMFTTEGDMNGRHNYTGKPALNPILGLLFVAGFILALIRIRNFHNTLFLLLFAFSLIPTLFTYPSENPNMLRTYTALPSVVYFIGLALTALFQRFSKNKIIVATVLFLIVISSLYELRTYFVYQSRIFMDDAYKLEQNLKDMY
jgi:4-amino-4-deoxy-L-arabinose transferase-like glycosyltransferase